MFLIVSPDLEKMRGIAVKKSSREVRDNKELLERQTQMLFRNLP